MAAERSRMVIAAYFFGIAGVISLAIGILGIQIRLLTPMVGFSLFVFGTLVGGLCALVLGAIGLIRSKRLPAESDRKRAMTATALGIALLAILLLSAGIGGNAPPINDITTDLREPPEFAPAEVVSAYLDREMSYPMEIVNVVRVHYPDLAPLDTPLPPPAAYAQALATARALGFRIVWESPEQGRFDATDTTSIFRFVDDVTVRVRPLGNGSRIDVRSKSRDGQGDLGANANRIRRFLESY